MVVTEVLIKKADDELQVVYAEVYVPNVPDAHGDFMKIETVRVMAYEFMRKGITGQVDTNHDNVTNGSYVVESFIARPGDPDFIQDAWVVGVHVPDPVVWEQIKSGELNGFSIEALVTKVPTVMTIEVPDVVSGGTDTVDGHFHGFRVNFDEEANFLGGTTSVVNDHQHKIKKPTITEEAEGHTHRFSFLEDFING